MILKTEKLKDASTKILSAIDSDSSYDISATVIDLHTEDSYLLMSVTNREYYVSERIELETQEDFHAVVDGKTFLNLISKVTTSTIEFKVDDKVLYIKANGNYKIPLVYDDDGLIKVNKITIDEVTNEFKIKNTILKNILKFNSKEIQKKGIVNAIQKEFYIDDKGAITFTTGACVNSFTLDSPVRLLLNEKLVKLFKLFNSEEVNFKIGFSVTENGINQTKVEFSNDEVLLSAIIKSDEASFSKVPVNAIRSMANKDYSYSISIDRNVLLETLNRLSVFNTEIDDRIFFKFVFGKDSLVVSNKENIETVPYANEISLSNYTTALRLSNIKSVLEVINSQYIIINFGESDSYGNPKNSNAIVVVSDSIRYIIPEGRLMSEE